MISIIHPSRSRPELAYKASAMWLANPGCDVEYILSLDKDDPMLYQYAHGFPFGKKSKVITQYNRSAIDAINRAASLAEGDILIVISDDFVSLHNWGKKIYLEMHRKADWILKTQDGIQDWVITLPIMDRVYYERFGYIYNPSYRHAFSDTEMTCVAELTGCLHKSQLMFPHLNKPGTKIMDEVQERNDATFEEGRKLFIERKKNNFGLPSSDIVSYMTPNVYTRM